MTSNDRHASHDSPYRTGQHVPLSQSKHAPLTSVATSASDSRTDLSASYSHEMDRPMSPHGPYSPGMRSLQRQESQQDTSYSANGMGISVSPAAGEIQMQSFNEGLPPPPPVGHSWTRIDRWTEDNYEELFENIGEGCTQNDINYLEHELDCTLPQEVRDSLQIHDGQERGGRPTGLLFGCMLLDCEEIVQEWKQWGKVNEDFLLDRPAYVTPQPLPKAFAGSAPSSSSTPAQQAGNPNWRTEFMARQDSQPPNAVQKAYVHPSWIPLARDWGGNNICVDLAPAPAGKWGQVILMGRDYDCKYVISRSWAAFLATVADDMSTDKWFINEETHELKLREFKQPNVEPAYIDILRWRADQKYGRRVNGKKRPQQPLRINSNVKDQYSSMNGFSPYASPADNDRGRSPQRYQANGKAPMPSSPRPHISSPLARVAEEFPGAGSSLPNNKVTKLVSIDSPVTGAASTDHLLAGKISGTESIQEESKEADTTTGAEEMKSVDI